MNEHKQRNRHILVIDDNESIHEDFRAILGAGRGDTAALDEDKAAILGAASDLSQEEYFEIDSASQGEEGLKKVRQALDKGQPYAMAFVDVRTPPGWDGIETIQRIWAEYPELQVVICTAYTDYQWHDIVEKLGWTDQLLILKKPFHNVEVRQLACAMTEKWFLSQQSQLKQEELREKVKERTCELEAVNAELNQEIIERRQAEEEAKVSLREKEMLLREIHHRVKNNMQVISSLLRLQSRAIEDKETIEIFKESQNRIKSMALVHEKIYHSKDLSGIDFADYIRELANGLVRFYGIDAERIALKFDVKGVSLGINSAISCGLLINELLSNSLKYAFPESKSGEIRVFLRTIGENDIKLKVSDNGVGLPEDLDFRKSQSLGLQLVTTLVEDQLAGKIELNRNGGTEFKITFKRTHATKAKPPELSFPPETVCAAAGHR